MERKIEQETLENMEGTEKENDDAKNEENVSRRGANKAENNKENTEESIKSSLLNVKQDAKNEATLKKNTKLMTSKQNKDDIAVQRVKTLISLIG